MAVRPFFGRVFPYNGMGLTPAVHRVSTPALRTYRCKPVSALRPGWGGRQPDWFRRDAGARIAGHKTGVSLEDAFWRGLKNIAQRMTMSDLIGKIDVDREHGNFSSALRLFVLNHYRARAG